jgi:hypothetical protein
MYRSIYKLCCFDAMESFDSVLVASLGISPLSQFPCLVSHCPFGSPRLSRFSLQFGYVWILLCEGLTPEQQLWNYKRRIENDVETELRENLVEDFKVTSRRLRLCLLGQDPHDAAAAAAAAASNPQ